MDIAAQVGEGVLEDTRDLGESWFQVPATANTLEVPPTVGHGIYRVCTLDSIRMQGTKRAVKARQLLSVARSMLHAALHVAVVGLAWCR